MGLSLKTFAMKLPRGLQSDDNFSKIVAYTRGDASLFVKNVLEVRMGHHKFKLNGGIGQLKSYFADTPFIKNITNNQLNSVKAQIQNILTQGTNSSENGEGETNTLPTEVRNKLETALGKITQGQNSINKVEDDNDFNAENLFDAKKLIKDGLGILKELKSQISSFSESNSGSDGDSNSTQQSIDYDAIEKSVNKKINNMRKISMDQFEENFSGELFIGSHHNYKYTRNMKQMVEWAQETLKLSGLEVELDSDKLTTPEALEAMVIVKLNKDNITYKTVEFEQIGDFDESEYPEE